MLSAVRSTIYHVLNWADKTLSPPVAIDTFNEFQLRDIGLTRDQEHIRARVGDAADPWQWPEEVASTKPQPSRERKAMERPRPATVSPRAAAGENKDISISLCD
ncbi:MULTISPECIES: hypothetical protein [unclassified Ensifer]|uniref:hypothetical protein n=1 Tax=unclassified Ensifer TaxID=2633371 RepID=UPI000888B761|nr:MULTISPECIES: hypothetical protein [unclassified Ensifer]MBD9595403.1 hypothetical protein [Ensifer sp. ENS05]SDM42389.1 hypothetical protein SAMN05216328_10951 [Ensifer sp. YR511]